LASRRQTRIHQVDLHSDVLHSKRMQEAHNQGLHGSAPGTTPNRIQGNSRGARRQNEGPLGKPIPARNGIQGH
jgi:hypothetical protein